MDVVLALCAACVYGVADYSGGRASRGASAIVVTFVGQAAALVLLLVMVLAVGTPLPPVSDLAWGGVAGIAGSTGLMAFYRAMGSGYMTAVAPVSAVTATALPVVVGLATGERPGLLAVAGIPIALLAIALVSDVLGPDHRRAPRIVLFMSFAAGLAFGSIFVILGHTNDDGGLWPIVAMRIASVPYMYVVVRARGMRASDARPQRNWVLASGVLDTMANGLYLLAVRQGLMSIVATINSFYPASTLILATRIDGERIHRSQAWGLVLAGVALVMITQT